MVTYKSLHDHAVVLFSGDVDWASVCQLTDLVDTLVERHFHTRIELVIASPGGVVAALDHYLECTGRWRARGVRLRTRVVSHAFSAAAVMLSLGDERVAERGARLLYHPARVHDAGPITARESTEMHDALRRIDDATVTRLVARVLDGGACVRVPYGAEPSDRRVLEALAADVAVRPGEKPPRRLGALARRVGQAVTRAVQAGDRETLGALYRRLAEPDRAISATLALTLRLVDRVGVDEAAVERRGGDDRPGLTVAQWRALYPPHGVVPRALLTRHTLVLGETGSGKSASAVLPVCAAMAQAPPGRVGAALIIDPKREAGPVLEALAPGRLRHITASGTVLDLMASPAWSLEADLAAGRWLNAATRVLLRVHSLVPATPARVLAGHTAGDGNQEFFDREGVELLLMVLAFVLMLTGGRAPAPESWLDPEAEADAGVMAWVRALVARARGEVGGRGANVLALAAWALTGPLTAPMPDGHTMPLPGEAGPPPHEWPFARAARRARAVWGDGPGEGRDVLDRVVGYWEPMSRIERQYAGVLATARTACSALADATLARRLYFGCEPGYAAAREAGEVLDFARAVSREGGGPLVLYQPALGGPDELVARALKAAFFEAVLHDPDRARGCEDLPLVGYVADEFHRFVTSDRVHGEQSFLDTCRSFGAFCVLACQSVAGIEHALAAGAGSGTRNEAAVSMLMTNTATKLVFRSTDTKTLQPLHEWCPHHPGLDAVTRVRPPTTLAPGECYALLPDGRFERRRLEPFETPAERARDRQASPARS